MSKSSVPLQLWDPTRDHVHALVINILRSKKNYTAHQSLRTLQSAETHTTRPTGVILVLYHLEIIWIERQINIHTDEKRVCGLSEKEEKTDHARTV